MPAPPCHPLVLCRRSGPGDGAGVPAETAGGAEDGAASRRRLRLVAPPAGDGAGGLAAQRAQVQVACGQRLAGAQRGWSFCLVFAGLTVAPTFPILVAQRFLYVPSFGICLLFGLVLERILTSAWVRDVSWKRRPIPNQRILAAALAFFFIANMGITMSFNIMWGYPSHYVRRQVNDIQDRIAGLPRGGSVYLLNLWPPAFGIELVFPLLAEDPALDIQVLTIHPKMLPLDGQDMNSLWMKVFQKCMPEHVGEVRTEAVWEDGDTLRVRIEGGRFMKSLVEEIYPASPSVQKPGTRVENHRFSAEVTRADAQGVQEIVFRFKPSAKYPRIVLDVGGGQVRCLEQPADARRTGSCRRLRHSCATHMLEDDGGINLLQPLFGHVRFREDAPAR